MGFLGKRSKQKGKSQISLPKRSQNALSNLKSNGKRPFSFVKIPLSTGSFSQSSSTQIGKKLFFGPITGSILPPCFGPFQLLRQSPKKAPFPGKSVFLKIQLPFITKFRLKINLIER